MTQEEIEWFAAMASLFESAGWKALLKDMADIRDKLVQAAYSQPNWDSYNVDKGRLEVFNYILNMEQFVDQAKRSKLGDNDD